jgi:hypothetical protein
LSTRNSSVENRENQMTDKTAIQRIKELDQERSTLFERANQAVEGLNALGLHYRLVMGAAPAGKAPAGNKSPGKKPHDVGPVDKKRAAKPPG